MAVQTRFVDHHEWQRGSRVRGDAERSAQQFEHLRSRHGALRKIDVIEANQPQDAPLHEHFEWDDGVAGHLYRLEQAAQAIRSLRRVVVNARTEETEPPERVYIPQRVLAKHDPESQPESHTYVLVPFVEQETNKDDQIRSNAITRIERLVAEFRSIPALEAIAGDLDDLLLKYR